jgi:hypothetical protein
MDSYQLRYCLLSTIDDYTYVCAVDQLHNIKTDSFFVICNNQPSTENGMHWIAFHKSKQEKNVQFFDSFGLPLQFYPKQMIEFCKKHGINVSFSDKQYQSNFSDLCGNFSLYFLIKRAKGYTFDQIVKCFDTINLVENETIVKDFVSQNFKFPSFSECETFCKMECMKRGLDLSGVCIQQNKTCKRINSSLITN